MPTHVLVNDDDSETREMLCVLREDAGEVVAEAADGAIALDVLHVCPDRLVVPFDYWMRRMDGAALLVLAEGEQMLAQRRAFVCMTASPKSLPPALSALLARSLRGSLGRQAVGIDELLAVISQAAQRLALVPAPASPPQNSLRHLSQRAKLLCAGLRRN